MNAVEVPLIVGTGPSGVACAQALIDRGIRPVMVDGGIVATERGREAAGEFGSHGSVDDAGRIRSDPGAKLWFGSGFATQQHPGARIDYDAEVVARASFATGGLSRIWGGTFSFFRDFETWPTGARPSQSDLQAVGRLVPSSVTDLSEPPGPGRGPGSIRGSGASARVMRAFQGVARNEWDVVEATVAIDTREGSPAKCILRDTCLDGCPVDAIWYAGDQVRKWIADGSVTYLGGQVVDAVSEADDLVRLALTDGTSTQTVTAPRVYLAAGGIATGAVLVRSGLRREIVLKDTATAFAGVLELARSGVEEVPHHGLSQWWARSVDGEFLAQWYPPSPANVDRLAARLPWLFRQPRLLAGVSGRLHPLVAYVGGGVPDRLRITMSGDAVRVSALRSEEAARLLRARLRALARRLLRTGCLLPVFATEFSAPGTGYHFGASLPHGSGTDEVGRPSGLRRIHIVDSTVLPGLEVGSITPTVMANAFRIARQSSAEEPA
jgi:hypothetical protein